MSELAAAIFGSPINLVLSVVLLGLVGYWLLVVLGALAVDGLDVDLDLDADVDADIDADVGDAFAGASVLRLLGVGELPVLILLTVFVLVMWVAGVLSYPLVGGWGGWSVLVQLAAFVPAAGLGLVVTAILTMPVRVLYQRMKAQEDAEQRHDIVGKRAVVVSLTATDRGGQAEVETDGAPLKLTVKTNKPGLTLNKGDDAVVVGEDEATGHYLITNF